MRPHFYNEHQNQEISSGPLRRSVKKLLPTLPLSFLVVFLIFIGLVWWNTQRSAPSNDSASYPFVIKPGENASSVGQDLKKEGFIRSDLAFRIYVQVSGVSKKIKSGDYRLQKNKPLESLTTEIIKGPIALWVTLPEGLRREEMAQKISTTLGFMGPEKQKFVEDFLEESEDKEGFLFPDTYLLLKNTTAASVVDKLTENFKKRVSDKILEKAEFNNLTQNQMITLASIVERETRTDEERPIVAGILLTRLDIGMPLQADATLQYISATNRCQAIDTSCEWWKPIKVTEKETDSPYNTYKRRGLPPAPIANPGLAAIAAVANPEDSPYLFYLHGSNGQIHYAKTIEEHSENIRKYLN